MNANIGENIKVLRSAKNMTQTDLADRINVTKATISAYENSTRMPSYDVLIKIASVFHVTTDNLLGFSNKYMVDESGLNQRQRNVVNEIVQLNNFQNEKIKELVTSDSVHANMVAYGYVNEFDIEDYKKNILDKGKSYE